ncbi:MAG: YbhB/YbcL family Raf kinase inhibitor-like protein [Erysipelotrichaceae bacterium]
MYITSTGCKNGLFDDKYGKRGTQFNENGVANYSIPFKIEDAPANSVSFAFVLEDKDAYPVSGGFVWIHWLGANLTRKEVLENESISATDFVQGMNSWVSIQGGNQSLELSSYYGGCMPPDAPHLYELHVYALDTTLKLEKGFLMNDLYKQMDQHILMEATLKATYNS